MSACIVMPPDIGDTVNRVARVVYVVESPLSARDKDRFGMTEVARAGFEVEAWEVDQIYLPRADASSIPRAEGVVIERFTRESRLRQAVESLGAESLVLSLSGIYLGQLATHRPFLESLARSRCVFAAINSGHRPPPSARTALSDGPSALARMSTSIGRALSTAPVGRLERRRARGRILGPPTAPRHLDYLWAGTRIHPIEPSFIGPGTVVRYVHTVDYDAVFTASLSTRRPTIDALYLDTMGPLHPDFAVSGVPVHADTEAWFTEVDRVLSDFETTHDCTVTIAAHPRASRDEVSRWYRNRPLADTSTAEAIARSRVVLATSGSTSLGLVAALEVPAVAIRVSSIHRMHHPELEAYSEALGLPLVEACEAAPRWPVPVVDAVRYRAFVEEYMKRPGTAMVPFWEQVARDIVQMRTT